MSELARDAVTLAELQARLLKLELRGLFRCLVIPVALLVFAFGMAVGCAPVFLLSLGSVLVQVAGLARAPSLLIAAATGLAIAGVAVVISLHKLQNYSTVLESSRAEFRRNVSWIKQMLKHQADSTGESKQAGSRSL